MAVDLPDPLGPMTATNSPVVHLQVDAGQRVHLGVALAVGPHDLVELDDRLSHGAHWFVAARSTITGVPGVQLSAPQHRHRAVGRARASTSIGLSSPPASVQTCGGASSVRTVAPLRTRRTRKEPEATPPRCCAAGGVKRSAAFGTSSASRHPRDRDLRRGRHPGLQQALGVVDAQHRLIRHDAVRVFGVLRTSFTRDSNTRSGYASTRKSPLADLARCRYPPRRRR